MEERLQKFLARAGVASRRKAEELITAGEVTVNGERAELGSKVSPDDDVRVGGKVVQTKGRNVTYMLHKPVGIVSTASDELGRKTIMDLVPRMPGLHPVGRLDMDSEGLILLTNDGDLTLHLSHPRYGHEKTYRVWCKEGQVRQEVLRKLEEGIKLEDGPAQVVKAKTAVGGCVLIMQEGRNRQVRRMLEAVGYSVSRLKRTHVGGLSLGELAVGKHRELTKVELSKLKMKSHASAASKGHSTKIRKPPRS